MNDCSSINGLHDGRYLWRKEWVRPHESMYSILKNFCTVNVLNSREAFKALLPDFPSDTFYYQYPVFFEQNQLCYIRAKWTFPASEFLMKLVPEWYVAELNQFPKIVYQGETYYGEKKRNGEIGFYKKLRVCPLCMKENYHSYYHNIIGVEKCFIHDVPLETKECLYNLSCIICSAKAPNTVDNAFYGIIPTERACEESIYTNNNVIQAGFDKIYPVLVQRQNETNPCMWHLLSGDKEPDRIIQIPKCDDSGEVYCERFVKEFECYHLQYSVWDTNPIRAKQKPELNWLTYYLDILTWTREIHIRSIIGKIPDEERHKICDYNEMLRCGNPIPTDNELALKMCFLWAYADTHDPDDALSIYKIKHPNAYCNLGRLCRIGIEDSLERFYDYTHDYWEDMDSTKTNVKIVIQQDYMIYLFEQFIELCKDKEAIDPKKWMDEIEYPCYYVLEKKGEEGYTIYRFNNS